jgi:hypothetical protein
MEIVDADTRWALIQQRRMKKDFSQDDQPGGDIVIKARRLR